MGQIANRMLIEVIFKAKEKLKENNIYVLHMKPMDSKGMGESYEKTKPWHPLYNINLFSVFGYLYMNGLTAPTMGEALLTGLLWAGICIVFDVFSWVLIKLRGA